MTRRLSNEERKERKRERDRKWRAANPDKVREYRQRRRVVNREHLRKWRAANPEKMREYHHRWAVANPEKVAQQQRRWAARNREKTRERSRLWAATHPDKVAQKDRRWLAANPDKRRATRQKRRARKAGNGGSHTAEQWQALCAQYDNRCIGPGPHEGPLEPDHVIPVISGGTSYISNIQPLCQACNRRKSKKTIDYR